MKLSIVATLYFSEQYIQEFYNRLEATLKRITEDYEIVFVNDCSPDRSKEIVLNLQAINPKVHLIDLSRNFGHHKAIMTGLMFACGEFVFLIDTDLEEDPEGLEQLWSELHISSDVSVVYGVQRKRKGKFMERVAGSYYYRLLYLITGYWYPANTLTSRIMSRPFIDGLKRFTEKEFDIWTLFVLNGFVQKPVFLAKKSKGTSTYTLKRKVRMAIDMITSFSTMPLYLIAAFGVIVLFSSFLPALYMIYLIMSSQQVTTNLALLTSVWFIGGMILSALGVMSIYQSKMFLEIKNRPIGIVKNIYSSRKQIHEEN